MLSKQLLWAFALLALLAMAAADGHNSTNSTHMDKDMMEEEEEDMSWMKEIKQNVFDDVTVGGAVGLVCTIAISALIVLARDIMKVVDFGISEAPTGVPARQLTTMSAAYAGETGAIKN
mmetsp:Transcript_44005/g.68811  ORF Transcript_44005/g.68811 Transcript_44005/m.68811 type:complete len:119 (+) Transcript_44005:87-443(+)|eukprot:CAMPEP_0184290188 /NCGR_PEP_ID=MMETSP1049-20130417/2535_1 /TAXON_ID=77928 /ORGANISM="Proteomonas sulcata, Strain CCMP704" /LENGTH=118 /DNA_ID=CAMNT_0026597303 /DNA_START=85 /DNA_END=441 /DNA_ORIENTATION=+